METFKLTEKEVDIICEALTMYSQASAEGSYAYKPEEIDLLAEKFGAEA
jgi:hypothetical protein